MANCIFCKIIAGEIPSQQVYSDEHVVAFLDINPGTRGHTLIVPRTHRRDLFDLQPDEMTAVLRAAQHIAAGLRRALQPAGFNLHHSTGEVAGQVVMHFHMHLLPRYAGDTVCEPWRPGDGGTDVPAVAQLVRAALAKA
jgi:histidine triad (HIT) family protein